MKSLIIISIISLSIISWVSLRESLKDSESHQKIENKIKKLPKSSFSWNPEELILGLAHWDEVYPGRVIKKGKKVSSLQYRTPLKSFEKKGKFESHYKRFIRNQNVAGLLILHQGKIILETYSLGYSSTGRWASQSVAKSITSTLVGMAIKEGYIKSINDKVTQYIKDLKGSAYDEVSIKQLLTMTSGVQWNENYSSETSDVSRFYSAPILPGMDATSSYMSQLKRDTKPGEKWVYKTGETHLLGVLVSKATGCSLSEYLSKKLWIPLGMEQDATWSLDRTQNELGGCCMQVSLKDYARFGQFILNESLNSKSNVLPKNWIKNATRNQVVFNSGQEGYGYQWWTHSDGSFQALGIHGQLIHIDPKYNLVIVINSAWPEATHPKRSYEQYHFIRTIKNILESNDTHS